MADTATTVTTANDIVVNAAIATGLIREARANAVISDRISRIVLPDMEGPRAATVAAHQALAFGAYSTEGAQADAVAWSTDGVTITATLRTLDVLIPELLLGSGIKGMTPALMENMGRAAIDDVEKAILALNSTFSASVGTTATALSLASWRAAITTLRTTGLDDADPQGFAAAGMKGYLHPTNVGQILEEVATSGAGVHFQPASAQALVNRAEPGNKGFIGTLHGAPLFETTGIVSDGTDCIGALMFPSAATLVVKYLARYAMVEMPWLRSVRHMATNFYAVALTKNAAGVKLIGVD